MKIYHHQQCSKSSCALEWLQQNGKEPQIIDYLTDTLSRAELVELLSMLNMAQGRIRWTN